ncbi:helix-turn-helix domain-containing protein [Nocardioides sp. BP30]|uniref:winged helix-turn-helix transcriptional regulator n=1 Tax=Nocardioides sp. BP30 TaxID=3036374 RepID=UPI002468ABFD|nr:helix-turn-helix domain-containing protein [Nocardioides sp. BP30]WGL52038.1 helix-turn-helix domain-containing protein [Nocardioides sp. BP30]
MAISAEVRDCSIAKTLDVIGEKWSLLVIRELLLGTERFEEIARFTGAPRDILTRRLRTLEHHGLVERRRYSEHPPRSSYHLTDLGRTLAPIVAMLRQWGDEHLAGPAGPPLVLQHSCGAILHAEVVCTFCGEAVTAGGVSRASGNLGATAPTPLDTMTP